MQSTNICCCCSRALMASLMGLEVQHSEYITAWYLLDECNFVVVVTRSSLLIPTVLYFFSYSISTLSIPTRDPPPAQASFTSFSGLTTSFGFLSSVQRRRPRFPKKKGQTPVQIHRKELDHRDLHLDRSQHITSHHITPQFTQPLGLWSA